MISLLELANFGDDAAHQNRREPDRRLVDQEDGRRCHERPADREHLLLATAHAARELSPSLVENREGLEAEREVLSDIAACGASKRAEHQILLDRQLREQPASL